MEFRVKTTAEADEDADSILEWLVSQHAGNTGLRWYKALEDSIASLANFPNRCPLAPENSEFPFEVRQLLYGQAPHLYRILFTIDNGTVYVLHIRHGRLKQLFRH